MPVGSFPGTESQLRRTVRAPVNPMDKSTVVSIFPRSYDHVIPTVTPSRYPVPAGSYDNPATLIVGPASWWKEVDEHQPLLEIPCGSNQVADSIVKDHCNGLVGCDMVNSMPGIFWLPGEITVAVLKVSYRAQLDVARTKQHKFWEVLIKYADTFWARTSGSPLSISTEMRIAAHELGLDTSKDWMKDFAMMAKINCKACGSPVTPGYPVCGNCKAIVDPEKAKELGIKFAS